TPPAAVPTRREAWCARRSDSEGFGALLQCAGTARRATDMVRATILVSGSALAAALAVSLVYAGHGSARGRATPPYITRAVGDGARPEADTKRDADRHPALTLAFAGVKPGDQVAELIPGSGYFTRLLSAVVGPKGKVYAVAPPRRPDAPADQPDPAARLQPITSDSHYGNVTVFDPGIRGHTDQFIFKFRKPRT